MVADGTFREDLLYRINTIAIDVPPLRKRGKDIIKLTQHFLMDICKKYNKKIPQLNEKIIGKLLQHAWPGNVRELQHNVERAVLLHSNNELQITDFFPAGISEARLSQSSSKKLEDVEKEAIEKALSECGGNLTRAAKQLGISRSTLYLKIEKYGL